MAQVNACAVGPWVPHQDGPTGVPEGQMAGFEAKIHAGFLTYYRRDIGRSALGCGTAVGRPWTVALQPKSESSARLAQISALHAC